jgi:hypothetical protein
VGEAAASAEPDAIAGVDGDGGVDDIVPDEAAVGVVVYPAVVVEDVDAAIGADPDAAVGIGGEGVNAIGAEAGGGIEMASLADGAIGTGPEAGDAEGVGIADEDGAIGKWGEVVNAGVEEAIALEDAMPAPGGGAEQETVGGGDVDGAGGGLG